MQWQQIIEFLGGTAMFGGVIAYLGKIAIDAYVSGRVEAYKGELQRVTTEHSVRFQRLHSERAEVIKEFYGKFVQLDETLHSTLRAFQQAGEPEVAPFVRTVSSVFKVESLPGVRLPVRPSAASRHTLRPGSFSLILNGAGTCCTSPNTA